MTQNIKKEFSSWVLEGKSQGMQDRHYFMWEHIFKEGNLKSGSIILDLCCGNGWAVFETARNIKNGFVVGIDISTSMLGSTAPKMDVLQNTLFLNQDATTVKFSENQFTHVFSIEALYYIKNISALFKNISRWLKPNGCFLFVINYYNENPYTTKWPSQINIPIYSRSLSEYKISMEKNGLKMIDAKRIYEPWPLPKHYYGQWFKDINELEKFRNEGALLVVGQKSSG